MVYLSAYRAVSVFAGFLSLGREGFGTCQTDVSAGLGVTLLLPYYYQFVSNYLWGTCSWNSFGMLYAFAGFNGYLLLGHYLKNLEWSLKKTLAIGIPMFAVGYAVTFLGFRHITALPEYTDEMLELFFTYCSLNVVMMTIPVFMLAKKVKVNSERMKRHWRISLFADSVFI